MGGAAPTKREPNPAVVGLLEGMTPEAIARWIPDPPVAGQIPVLGPLFRAIGGTRRSPFDLSKEEVLDQLRRIADGVDYSSYGSSVDSRRIDPGRETRRAARLFCGDCNPKEKAYRTPLPPGVTITSSDIEAYWLQYRSNYWNERRSEIAQSYDLKVDHSFSKIFFDPSLRVMDLTSFRGTTAFDGLADVLPAVLPQVKEKRSLSVLYPGSGGHIAPLATAMKLIHDGTIDEARLTYTEIEEGWFIVLYFLLRIAQNNSIFESVTAGRWIEFGEKGAEGRERTLVVTYEGKPIRITFALNRSGKEWYREDDLKAADLVVIHDPNSGFLEQSVDLVAGMLLQRRGKGFPEQQAVVMEGSEQGTESGPVEQIFPAAMQQKEIPGQYGHCDGEDSIGEVSSCDYRSARLFRLDDPALAAFAAPYTDPTELSRAIYEPPMRPSRACFPSSK